MKKNKIPLKCLSQLHSSALDEVYGVMKSHLEFLKEVQSSFNSLQSHIKSAFSNFYDSTSQIPEARDHVSILEPMKTGIVEGFIGPEYDHFKEQLNNKIQSYKALSSAQKKDAENLKMSIREICTDLQKIAAKLQKDSKHNNFQSEYQKISNKLNVKLEAAKILVNRSVALAQGSLDQIHETLMGATLLFTNKYGIIFPVNPPTVNSIQELKNKAKIELSFNIIITKHIATIISKPLDKETNYFEIVGTSRQKCVLKAIQDFSVKDRQGIIYFKQGEPIQIVNSGYNSTWVALKDGRECFVPSAFLKL